jgi:hypothetical protein
MDPHASLPVHLFSNNATLKRRGNIRGYFKRVGTNNTKVHTRKIPNAPKKKRPVISRVHNLENIEELEELEGGRRRGRGITKR